MKTTLLLLLLVVPTSLWACRCDFTRLKKLEEDPTRAKIAFLAEVTQSVVNANRTARDVEFKVIQAWKGVSGETVKAKETTTSCELGLEQGKQYLILTDTPLSEILRNCHVIAMPAEQASVLITKLKKKIK